MKMTRKQALGDWHKNEDRLWFTILLWQAPFVIYLKKMWRNNCFAWCRNLCWYKLLFCIHQVLCVHQLWVWFANGRTLLSSKAECYLSISFLQIYMLTFEWKKNPSNSFIYSTNVSYIALFGVTIFYMGFQWILLTLSFDFRQPGFI